MDVLFDNLLDLLARETDRHTRLYALLNRESEEDGRMPGRDLLTVQLEKEKYVAAIRALEQERIVVVKELARTWNTPWEELTLRAIAAKAPESMAQALLNAHRELVALVEKIHDLATHTSRNAKARLKAVNATLDMVREALDGHSTYSDKGKIHKPQASMKHIEV
ncbi:MAG: flagellar protein FlgN [Deltaproteobacteria bacterium]|nr:flagellar protein FlgN [Deltaproteobacteria bacterium]